MKTLTVTDARKNLSKWLQAAARGEEIGIVSGADIIALRKVQVQAADEYAYAVREYGASRDDLTRFDAALRRRAAELDRDRKWKTFKSVEHLKAAVEKIAKS
jgi:antitoxin (DNA-binding transcriptional repressor) of toxin-antitoxin stability system